MNSSHRPLNIPPPPYVMVNYKKKASNLTTADGQETKTYGDSKLIILNNSSKSVTL